MRPSKEPADSHSSSKERLPRNLNTASFGHRKIGRSVFGHDASFDHIIMGDSLVHRPVTDLADPVHTMNATHYDQHSIRTDSRESGRKSGQDGSVEGGNSLIITEIKVQQKQNNEKPANIPAQRLWYQEVVPRRSSFQPARTFGHSEQPSKHRQPNRRKLIPVDPAEDLLISRVRIGHRANSVAAVLNDKMESQLRAIERELNVRFQQLTQGIPLN